MKINHSYVFLGIQGSGKGTQAQMIAKQLHIPHISMGDMLRRQVRLGTQNGIEAQKFLDKGSLVPDRLIFPMCRDRLLTPDCANGFLLDGFPRTLEQARELDQLLLELGKKLRHAVLIDLPEKSLYERLSNRFTCEKCNTIYNLIYSPPRVQGVCDRCGGNLYQRSDDSDPKAVAERIAQYHESTDPAIEYYRSQGILVTVPGDMPIEIVHENILKILEDQK